MTGDIFTVAGGGPPRWRLKLVIGHSGPHTRFAGMKQPNNLVIPLDGLLGRFKKVMCFSTIPVDLRALPAEISGRKHNGLSVLNTSLNGHRDKLHHRFAQYSGNAGALPGSLTLTRS